jgi:hypothetical protein
MLKRVQATVLMVKTALKASAADATGLDNIDLLTDESEKVFRMITQ